jgi:hypothetical protein
MTFKSYHACDTYLFLSNVAKKELRVVVGWVKCSHTYPAQREFGTS